MLRPKWGGRGIGKLTRANRRNFAPRKFNEPHKGHHLHYMYVFIKAGIPTFGIYHFKPIGKNRINPIFFDIEEPEFDIKNDKANLEILSELFYDVHGKQSHEIDYRP